MKNKIEYPTHFSNLEKPNFIQHFASAYMIIEATKYPETIFYTPETDGWCCGCSGPNDCKNDNIAHKRCLFFALFNTICGNSSMRRRFDGSPTEMQRLIGDTEDGDCGSDFTVDFLFGYTGYEYREITDPAAFKNEITASVDKGSPVIAKVKSSPARFRLVMGYDGDNLIVHNKEGLIYDETEALYIFGEKSTRRYTLKDGLENIRRVMEYNISEKLWDEYLIKLGGWDEFPSKDGLDKADRDEKKVRAKHMADTCMYMYNICTFNGAFCCSNLKNHYLCKEFADPVLRELWANFNDPHWTILDAGHKSGRMNFMNIWGWGTIGASIISELSAEICREIIKVKEADAQLLDVINFAIEILPLSSEQKSKYLPKIEKQREEYLKKAEEWKKAETARKEAEKARKEAEERGRIIRLTPALELVEAAFADSECMEIDLSSLIKCGEVDVKYENGLMTMEAAGDKNYMSTEREFGLPLKINLRARNDNAVKPNVRIKYGKGVIAFNDKNALRVFDFADGKLKIYDNIGKTPLGEFFDIECIITADFLAVKLNGEIKHMSDDYGYIKALKNDPGCMPPSPVAIAAAWTSVVTVEHLRVTEI